jgi:hypothetical protein
MPFHDTRLGPGTLKLGPTATGQEYGFQVSALALTPATSSTDGTPTLAVPDPPQEITTSYSLDGSAVNDFTNPTGLQRFCYDNDGAEMAFEWIPITAAGTTLAGTVQLQAFPMGGKVGEQLVTDFSWPCVGKPAWSADLPLAAAADAASEKGSKRGAAA